MAGRCSYSLKGGDVQTDPLGLARDVSALPNKTPGSGICFQYGYSSEKPPDVGVREVCLEQIALRLAKRRTGFSSRDAGTICSAGRGWLSGH